MGKLSRKQKAFVTEYLKDKNAKQAAIRAGYSPKVAETNGPRLLRNAQIQKAVDAAQAKVEEKALVDAAYVLTGFKEVAERCMQHVPVMEFDRESRRMVQTQDDDGRDVWQFDSMGANKALECLGKHLKLFTEKHEVTGKDGGPIHAKLDLSGIDEVTLKKLAEGK